MELVDLFIIIILLAFALIGFSRGAIKTFVMLVGFVAIVVLSYSLKNYIGDFLVLNFPFLSFNGIYTLNIIVYQTIAFVIITIILTLLYKFVLLVTRIFDKIMNITLVFSLPSKIFGFVIGLLEGYAIIYFVLFVINAQFFNTKILEKSKYAPIILNNTPVVSSIAKESLEIFDEINVVTHEEDKNVVEMKVAGLILNKNITSVDVMQKLLDNKKIPDNGIQEIINQYKGDEVND